MLAPLNVEGDRNPSSWKDGEVTTTPGFKEAFRQFGEGGWQGVQHPVDYDGQGLPKLIATPCIEMLNAANLSFALCPLLTDGAIEALLTAGTEAQKQAYRAEADLRRMDRHDEPDRAAGRFRSRAGAHARRAAGRRHVSSCSARRFSSPTASTTWRRTSSISCWRARPNAPEGVKGISLFIVPKFLVNDDGSLGERNDVHCVSIEHKLGIKASPTAVLQFGDHGGAIGHLIGEENRGLEYMFIMMNAARFAVGMQGVGVVGTRVSEGGRVCEGSRAEPSRGWLGEAAGHDHSSSRTCAACSLTMRALTEASRALAYVAAAHCDIAHRHPDEASAREHQAIYEFLVPIVKGWSTELSIDVTSLGVQVHGGMGFIEETGAAQYYRDARILTIYEGTTAIQANDLIGRKTVRDGGAMAQALLARDRSNDRSARRARDGPAFESMQRHLAQRAACRLSGSIDFVVANAKGDPNAVFAGSVPYLKLAGIVLGGWQMARALLVAAQKRDEDPSFYGAKIATAQFYAEHVLSQASALEASIVSASGGESVLALSEDQF